MTILWNKNLDKMPLNSHTSLPRLLSVGLEEPNQRQILRAMHCHDDRLEINYLLEGNAVYEINGEKYTASKGDIVIFNCNTLHDEHVSGVYAVRIYSCAIDNIQYEGIPRNSLTDNHISPIISCLDDFETIKSMFNILYDTISKKSNYARELNNNITNTLLLYLKRRIDEQGAILENRYWPLVQRIKSHIDKHYLSDIDLNATASQLNMSPSYLTHVFKAGTGYSPLQYIVRRRIGEAQSFLLETDFSVSEIAGIVGFNNISNFYKIFQKYIGVSPKKYREIYKPNKNT
jgi:AraC-like DNA-binding protein